MKNTSPVSHYHRTIFIAVFIFALLHTSCCDTENEDCGCNKLRRENLVSTEDTGGTCESETSCLTEPSENGADVSNVGDTDSSEKGVDSSSKSVIYSDQQVDILKSNPMIKIDGGKFFMGTAQTSLPQDGEGPLREVTMKSFYLDSKEVSNAEFNCFVETTGYNTEVCIYPIETKNLAG